MSEPGERGSVQDVDEETQRLWDSQVAEEFTVDYEEDRAEAWDQYFEYESSGMDEAWCEFKESEIPLAWDKYKKRHNLPNDEEDIEAAYQEFRDSAYEQWLAAQRKKWESDYDAEHLGPSQRRAKAALRMIVERNSGWYSG